MDLGKNVDWLHHNLNITQIPNYTLYKTELKTECNQQTVFTNNGFQSVPKPM